MLVPTLRQHTQYVLAEGMVRIGPSMAFPAVLEDFGIDAESFLGDFGLDAAYFDNPENILSLSTLAAMVGRGAQESGCRHFGLLVGQRAGLSSFGSIGFLMQSAPSVGAAIALLDRYFHLQSRGAMVHATNEGGFVTLAYTVLDRSLRHIDQIDSAAVAVGVNIMRGLTQPEWAPHSVQFAFARPRDIAPYRQFFRSTPRFDADLSGLVFPSRLLDQPLRSADPLLYRLMEDRVHELSSAEHEDLVGRLRRVLRIQVLTPDCSAESVAGRLGMHVRTLNRALANESTSFHRLREEIRFEVACRLLENTRTRAGEIASALGYSDASSFTRAFRRWSGTGPARWRAGRAKGRTRR